MVTENVKYNLGAVLRSFCINNIDMKIKEILIHLRTVIVTLDTAPKKDKKKEKERMEKNNGSNKKDSNLFQFASFSP